MAGKSQIRLQRIYPSIQKYAVRHDEKQLARVVFTSEW